MKSAAGETLFNSQPYAAANLREGQSWRCFKFSVDGIAVASVAGVVEGTTWCNGYSAPFGGIDVLASTVPPSALGAGVAAFLEHARAAGITRVRIGCRPSYYSDREVQLQSALLANGFSAEQGEISQAIALDRFANTDDYLRTLKDSARCTVRHGLKRGFEWRRADDDADWGDGFAVLERNKAKRGARMRYPLAYVRALATALPGRIRMQVLRDAGRAIAAALVYRIDAGADYVAAWGDADHDLAHSPMNLVALRLVEDALAARLRLLDLGISSDAGRADDGLVAFKRHVGATSALRLGLVRGL